MTHHEQLFCRTTMLVAALLWSTGPLAQEPAGATSPAPTAPPTPIDPGLAPENNPAIRAALELPRTEPADYLQAVLWLIDLGRPDLGKPILDELAAQNLTDKQRAALVDRFGSAAMLRIARTMELAPAGGQFAESAVAAAAAAARAPERIQRLIGELTSSTAEIRSAARSDLAAIGQPAVVALLEALPRANADQAFALEEAILTTMPLSTGPLLAMSSTQDPVLATRVHDLLVASGSSQAVPLLAVPFVVESPQHALGKWGLRERPLVHKVLGHDPTREVAETLLLDALRRYCHGSPPFPINADNQVELWHWDDVAKQLTAARFPAEEARIIWMARLAHELARLRPDNREYQRYALVLDLEAAALISAEPTIALASLDVSLVSEALADALQDNLPHAAVAVIDELGRRRDLAVLHASAPQSSPLANALNHPNRHVRFAALRAIITLDPQSPYSGSSRVPDALNYFAGSDGSRRAIVAMPTAARATDLAGKLAAYNLDADGFNNGHAAVKAALQESDLELVLVDMNILLPEARQVVYELRIHPTTGEVPVALLAPEGRLEAAQRIAAEHTRVIAVPRPHSPDSLAQIVERLEALVGRASTPADERAAQAVQATQWIAQLLAADRPFYVLHRSGPVLEAAVFKPDTNHSAVAALVELGTPHSQKALVNFASQTTLPAASRSAAAAAFAASVKAHGLLLTTGEIIAQYNLYNASAAADADTQKVLGAILDAIEAPRAANPSPPPWKMPPP